MTVDGMDESTLKTTYRKDGNIMKFDYTVLNMFISLYGGIEKTAEAAGMKAATLKRCLKGERAFKQVDMNNIIRALAIPEYCIQAAFFTKVEK